MAGRDSNPLTAGPRRVAARPGDQDSELSRWTAGDAVIIEGGSGRIKSLADPVLTFAGSFRILSRTRFCKRPAPFV